MNHLHHDINFNEHHNNDHTAEWLLFIGGFIINLLWLPQFLIHMPVKEVIEYLTSSAFAIHLIRSFTGGIIALSIKLFWDLIKKVSIWFINIFRSSNKNSQDHDQKPRANNGGGLSQ